MDINSIWISSIVLVMSFLNCSSVEILWAVVEVFKSFLVLTCLGSVSLDLSQITDTASRKMMEQQSSIFGDANFNTPCTHNTTHRIAVSTQPNFCMPRKLCPEKLTIAKSSFDEMQRLGIEKPISIDSASMAAGILSISIRPSSFIETSELLCNFFKTDLDFSVWWGLSLVIERRTLFWIFSRV